jgi:hypothetical protein
VCEVPAADSDGSNKPARELVNNYGFKKLLSQTPTKHLSGLPVPSLYGAKSALATLLRIH